MTTLENLEMPKWEENKNLILNEKSTCCFNPLFEQLLKLNF